MATDIPIRCECGSLRAVAHDVTRAGSNRVICYCDDCQASAPRQPAMSGNDSTA